jgi:hypothetical protein
MTTLTVTTRAVIATLVVVRTNGLAKLRNVPTMNKT